MHLQYRITIPKIAALMFLIGIPILLWSVLKNDVDVLETLDNSYSSKKSHQEEEKSLYSKLVSDDRTDENILNNSGKELIYPESKDLCVVSGIVTDSNGNIVPKAEVILRLTFDNGPEIWRTNSLVEADGTYSSLLNGLANLTPSTRSGFTC